MPVSLRKYYKRSRKLILTHYKKLKDENKQACDLMLHYSEDLRLAHRMKEWFYDICQMEVMTGLRMHRAVGSRNLRPVLRPTGPGEKKS
mgnify:CR=1 FL=1